MTIRQRIETLLSRASLEPNTLGTVRSVLTDKLIFGRKLVLAAVGLAAIAGHAGLGLNSAQQARAQSPQAVAAPPPSFEVASIKPSRSGENGVRLMMSRDRFTTKNLATKELIEFAYDAKDDQLSGGPSWINSEKYDIDAKEEDSMVERLQKLPFDRQAEQVRLMVQSLLADRFKLKVSHQTKELPIYELVVAKNGPSLPRRQLRRPVPLVPNLLDRKASTGSEWRARGNSMDTMSRSASWLKYSRDNRKLAVDSFWTRPASKATMIGH
jgi:uncharacterized protein (TIGR03435 family)